MTFDFDRLAGGLIVSCQAPRTSPLCTPAAMAALARAVVQGGAVAIRANSPEHVSAIRAAVDVPIIGLFKRLDETGAQWITPTGDDALTIAQAGADIVAIDATLRPRTLGPAFPDLLAKLRRESDVPVLADVDCVEAGQAAVAAGAEAVASTLSGYTTATSGHRAGPDLDLVRGLAATCPVPVIAEGRYGTADDVRAALAAGAHAVVVGTAITEPIELTARLVAAIHV